MNTAQLDQETKEKIGPALGRLASGVFIVTADSGSQKDGMLATWISQISFTPPMIAVAVHPDRPISKDLKPGSKFVVNVLAKSNNDIFKNFAKPHQEGMDRFEGLELLTDFDGGPAFKNGISCLACEVQEIVEPGDHRVVLAKIVDGRILNKEAEPMVHFRKDGFQY